MQTATYKRIKKELSGRLGLLLVQMIGLETAKPLAAVSIDCRLKLLVNGYVTGVSPISLSCESIRLFVHRRRRMQAMA